MTPFSQPRAIALGVIILAGAAAAWYAIGRLTPTPRPPQPPDATDDLRPDPAPPDPRLTFDTPFRNVRPGVAYVGDARCADCHAGICSTYHNHPMGRSAEVAGAAAPVERYDAAANNPFAAGPYRLRVAKAPAGVVHRVSARDAAGLPLPDYAVRVDVALGSGTRGRSYLSVEQGTAWQSPVSWFSAGSRWEVSPGFDLGTGGRRAVTPDCLFCHVDRVEPAPGALNRYREPLFPLQASIGCERCHGPGELHASERAAGGDVEKVDTSIVNPRHLSPELQFSVCAQCHLQGQERVARRGRDAFEFRPGLPYELFVNVFVRHPDIADSQKSVGQFEQLARSRCKELGGGRLLCTSCHDPHAAPAPAGRDSFYRRRCNACHETKPCAAPAAERAGKNDSCVACHMPRNGSSNIAHASVTDHRVLRRPAPPPPPRSLDPGAVPLVLFGRPSPTVAPEELDRDLGVALARVAARAGGAGVRPVLGRFARDRLAAALGRGGGDADEWHAMSLAHSACGDIDGRLEAAERAARLSGGSELALAEVAAAALDRGKLDRAEEAATAVVGQSPRSVPHLLTRAAVYFARGQWDRAEADCRAALAIHPLHPQARLYLAVCLHRRGDAPAGRREAETALGLVADPRQREAFRKMYERETR